jgi:hypothetical protein
MNRSRKYPRSYDYAVALLFDRRVRSITINDDLRLTFLRNGIAVLYNENVLIRWQDDRRRIVLIASEEERGATPQAVRYVSWFLPLGYHVQHKAGRMLLHHPTGLTRAGNKQAIVLSGTDGQHYF